LKSDPEGPRLDMVELFKGFGKRVVFVQNKESGVIEILGWELDDSKQVREGIAQLIGGDPDVTQVIAGQDVAWVTLGPQASAIALSGNWLMMTHNSKIADRLIVLSGPKAMDRALGRAMLRDLQQLVESNRRNLELVRKNNALGTASSSERIVAEAVFSDSQGQLCLVEGDLEQAVNSFKQALDLHELIVKAKREQYREGTVTFGDLNAAIEKRFVVLKKLEEAKAKAAAK
ncbi:MAG: hypothetical protein AAF497_12810, partial [Planctomycetota bacterium]